MPTIRTTMRPGDEIVVSDAEYEELLALGLIYDGTPPVEPADSFDLKVAARVTNAGSATDVALRAAFVAGGVLNNDGSPNATKKLMARLTADGTDIDDLFIESVS